MTDEKIGVVEVKKRNFLIYIFVFFISMSSIILLIVGLFILGKSGYFKSTMNNTNSCSCPVITIPQCPNCNCPSAPACICPTVNNNCSISVPNNLNVNIRNLSS